MNLNDRVRVVLTDKGLEVYREFHVALYRHAKKYCPESSKYFQAKMGNTDKVYETELWFLMEVFGPSIYMTAPMVFENNEIEVIKDLQIIPDQQCEKCGCTDENCSQCIEAQDKPCHWVDNGKCSRCFDEDGKLKESEAVG